MSCSLGDTCVSTCPVALRGQATLWGDCPNFTMLFVSILSEHMIGVYWSSPSLSACVMMQGAKQNQGPPRLEAVSIWLDYDCDLRSLCDIQSLWQIIQMIVKTTNSISNRNYLPISEVVALCISASIGEFKILSGLKCTITCLNQHLLGVSHQQGSMLVC